MKMYKTILSLGTFCAISLASVAAAQDWVYVVRPGDTTDSLSEKYLSNEAAVKRLFDYNGMVVGDTIRPGTRIKIPLELLKSETQPATLATLSGTGSLIDAKTGETHELVQGLLIRPNDRILVASNSSAIVEFADGSTMTIDADSEIVFETLSVYGDSGIVDTSVRLRRGSSENSIKRWINKPTRFRVTTPAGVSTVRGTQYRINSETDGEALRVEVLHGSVSVGGDAPAVNVLAGFGTLKEKGNAPLMPRSLLPAPEVDLFSDTVGEYDFEWPVIAGATAYRAQLSDNETFIPRLIDFVFDENRINLSSFNDNDYVLKLRGIDDIGLEGLDATHKFKLNVFPTPPTLLSPIVGDKPLRSGKQTFSWWKDIDVNAARIKRPLNMEFGRAFRFQLSQDADFQQLVIDQPLRRVFSYTPDETVEKGKYHWRVASLDSEGNPGPFSQPQPVVIR